MNEQHGFAVWITGIPASGKSSITREVVKKLQSYRVAVVALESDEMRRVLTPEAAYTDEERDRFYRQMALIGELITRSGVNVIFDATANKRAYRDFARKLIEKFIEVYVECPLEVCTRRDPKGIYARASKKESGTVPGLQVPYEPPAAPELVLDGQASPGTSAESILEKLRHLLYIRI